MTRFASLASTSALALCLGAGAAQADITAQEVWTDLQAYMTGFGYDITATTAQSGDTLNVTDLTMSMEIPDAEGTVIIRMGDLALVDRGDGTVSLSIPASWPLEFDVAIAGEDPVSGRLSYLSEGMETVISGSPGDTQTTVGADSITVQLDEVTAEGETFGSDVFRVVIGMDDVAGTGTMKVGELREFDQSGSVAQVTYDIDVQPPEEEEDRLVLTGTLDNLAFAATGAIPQNTDMADMGAAVEAGFAVDASYSYGPTQAQFSFNDNGDTVNGTAGAATGSFAMMMNGDRLSYEAGGTDAKIDLTGSQLPFPVSLAMAETGFKLSVPVQPTDDPQDFELDVTLGGFQMSDMIWSLFDMQGVLPRDPATIDIDLSGQARLFMNLFKIEDEMSGMGMGQAPAMPGELHQVTLDGLLVEAAGARLTGEGSFAIDNTDMETFDGMPRPEGELNLTLRGANALMDNLVQMGLLPQEQAMGARMMMGMFAVPGDGEDTLKSTIEVNEQGHVLANGQRLR